MEKGFTTGSCAAAAAKAAAFMLLSGREKTKIKIETPAGIMYCPDIEKITLKEDYACCAVKKQSGDDPDVTNGIYVYAKVSVCMEQGFEEKVVIEGGRGIGRVTRKGLDQPVGEAAINSVPRRMIETEVKQVMDLFDFRKGLIVEISAPEGEEMAKKTFNPRMGIEGGISIIGTTGIVEPMSTRAIIDTIRVELNQHKTMGVRVATVSPGNYGMDFMKENFDFDLDRAVKCSNYIGDTIDMARELGFKKLLLCGHIGKLIKLSGGIMNTHSREGDCRMELMAAAAARCGAGSKVLCEILDCVSTEEAVDIYIREKLDRHCFDYIMDRIHFFLSKRAGEGLLCECIMYSGKQGLLGKTSKAEEFLSEAKGEIQW